MDDTAGQLLHKIQSWLDEKEKCAKHLWKLVKDLDALSLGCKAGECVGSSISVVGAACLIGGAVATFFTAGAAAPFLGTLGAVYVGTGTTISLSSKLIEHFVSGSTIKAALKGAMMSEKIEEEIMELMEKLKRERVNTDQDESEYIAVRIAKAMGRTLRPGLTLIGVEMVFNISTTLLVFIKTFLNLSIKKNGKITKNLIAMIVQELAIVGGKSAAKCMVLAGGIGMVFALTESINNWKELVTKKHVTEASRSVRTTAENIDQFCKELRNNLTMIQEAIEQTNQQTNNDQGNQSSQNQQTNNDQGNQSNQNQQNNNDQGNQSNQNQQNNNDQGNQSNQNQQNNNDQGNKSNQNQQTNNDQWDDDDEDKRKNNRWYLDILCDEDPEGWDCGWDPLRMGLLNCRSMTKKAHLILDIIEQFNLDVFLTTETWLKLSNCKTVLQNASPPDHTLHHEERPEGRGGGVAIQHRNAYIGQPIRFPFMTVFEYVAVVMEINQWGVPVVLVNVYFPPGYRRDEFHRFVFDFNMLLEALYKMGYDHAIFTGDFNIHLDNGMQSSAIEFHALLHVWGLEQHVNQATHKGGHTLDLVFTWNMCISSIKYDYVTFSDHFLIIFTAIPMSPEKKKKINLKAVKAMPRKSDKIKRKYNKK